jgi:hypothetical protein
MDIASGGKIYIGYGPVHGVIGERVLSVIGKLDG